MRLHLVNLILNFFGESGAINEALSDIMGTAIEKYINNGEFNWTIGEQSGSVLRNMKKSIFSQIL